ncbi:isochorismate synthase [Halospeciosus flavus]|uniref:isochorismate synthase n=1 Tax=Halospeciosus flavus TaxID=3032283 RepID=A0ABD5Z2L2_9EURY|nr:isochorismate synthase [Halospeciosus flavus]
MGPRQNAGEAHSGHLVSRTERLSDASLSSLLRTRYRPHVVWSAPGEPSVVGCGAVATLTADGAGRVDAVREDATDLLDSIDTDPDAPSVARPRLFGGFAFHDDHEANAPWAGFPGAAFVLPRVQFTVTDEATWLTVTTRDADAAETVADVREAVADAPTDPEPRSPPGVLATERTPDRETWREQVESAVSRIRGGDLEKVVLAQSLAADLDDAFSLADTLDRLGATYPDCFRFAFRADGGGTFFGASPERLVTRHGGRLETGALASTIGRGETPAADAALERDLRESEKFRHEHDLVVESIREQLDPVAENVTTGERRVRKLATVQHLFTPMAADTDAHVLDLVDALHPTPAVGGLPPEAALDTIRETETFDRGWYAAPVGWVDADGDGTFAVAIRSAVAEDEAATLFAGNGIVADSDPDEEWKEVQLKFRPVLDHLERGHERDYGRAHER